LILSVIFGLILQFYLQGQVETYRNLQAQREFLTAQTMVSLAREELPAGKGTVRFSKGICSLDKTAAQVTLENGHQLTIPNP